MPTTALVLAVLTISFVGPPPAEQAQARPPAPAVPLEAMDGPGIVAEQVGLSAPLDDIRFEGSVIAPPDDVSRAGIWIGGAKFGDGGLEPTVLVGHVSDDSDRPGAFKAIWDLEPGMIATTRDAQGREREWRVVGSQRYEKDRLPRSLFEPGDERVLRLITCDQRTERLGGGFHYEDNLVVDLVPVDAPPRS